MSTALAPVDPDTVVAALEARLAPFGFVRRPCDGTVAAWVRKTWNTNRGVVVLELPAGADPVAHVAAVRKELGRSLKYIPFFYGVGMQIVLVGPEPAGPLEGAIDRYDTQRELVQSVFVIDPVRRSVTAAPIAAVETPWVGRALPFVLGAVVVLWIVRALLG